MSNSGQKPQRESLSQAVATQARQRAKSEVASRKQIVRSGIRSRIMGLIPSQFQWLLPFLESYRGDALEAEPTAPEALPEAEAIPDLESETVASGVVSLCRRYSCVVDNPIACPKLQAAVNAPDAPRECPACGFPVMLRADQEIIGHRGRYQIKRYLHWRGMGRLYQAVLMGDDQPVILKEYLLPDRTSTKAELEARKQAFAKLAGVETVNGRLQDYRLILPWEAIADSHENRCYLISKGDRAALPPLSAYLEQFGPMTETQVYQVLHQVLQTLEFLHQQKVRSPGGDVGDYGLAHGNLSLDSLLIALPNGQPPTIDTPLPDHRFFVFVCDLAIWEAWFDLVATPVNLYALSRGLEPTAAQNDRRVAQAQTRLTQLRTLQQADLQALGYVGVSLLTGQRQTPTTEGQLDLNDNPGWQQTRPEFRHYLLRLMGLESPFEHAVVARQALRAIAPDQTEIRTITPEPEAPERHTNRNRLLWFLAALLFLLGLGGLFWWLWPRRQTPAVAGEDPVRCWIADVSGVPAGEFLYVAEANGPWQNLLKQNNLVDRIDPTLEMAGDTCKTDKPPEKLAPMGTLGEILSFHQPQLQLYFMPTQTQAEAISLVEAEKVDFAIASLTAPLPLRVAFDPVVYDGLAVFVSFSYAQRENSLPHQLRGRITIPQLQQLYTGRITNWKELGGPDLPVRLYAPQEPALIQIFEEKVLQTPENIASFRDLLANRNQTQAITILPTIPLLRSVIRDFEDTVEKPQVGAIAFDRLSQIFGQCAVYPLAIATAQRPAVQPLVKQNGESIGPTTDLCLDKGTYEPDPERFRTGAYPLSFTLAVVYPRDNSRPPAGHKFAAILQTREGQSLLKQTGFVPLGN